MLLFGVSYTNFNFLRSGSPQGPVVDGLRLEREEGFVAASSGEAVGRRRGSDPLGNARLSRDLRRAAQPSFVQHALIRRHLLLTCEWRKPSDVRRAADLYECDANADDGARQYDGVAEKRIDRISGAGNMQNCAEAKSTDGPGH